MSISLGSLANALNAALEGDGEVTLVAARHPADAGPDDLAIALTDDLVSALGDSKAGAVLVTVDAALPTGAPANRLRVATSAWGLAGATAAFQPPPAVPPGIHPSAVIAETATVAADATVGPFCVVGPEADIGAGCVLLSHVTVGARASVGAGGLLHSGVRIGDDVRIGERAIIHGNAVIGADGFSFKPPDSGSVEAAKKRGRVDRQTVGLLRVHSLGAVIVGADVEIGAATTIDRGTLRDTRIGAGTKIDNQVQIGHNCVIGSGCMLCGQVGLAGSVTVGDRVVLAGKVGVADHVTIGDDAVIAAGSGVGRDVPANAVMVGYPAVPKDQAFDDLMAQRRLKRLIKDVEDLKNALRARND